MGYLSELKTISEYIENNPNVYDISNVIPDYMRCIGSGNSRIVYELSDTKVVKFEKFPQTPNNQTRKEVQFYNQIRDTECKQKFAEITDYISSRFVIQEKLITDKHISKNQISDWEKEVCEFGVRPYDLYTDNFGYKQNGEIAMLDYSNNFFSN